MLQLKDSGFVYVEVYQPLLSTIATRAARVLARYEYRHSV